MAGASDPESAECKPAWQTSIEWLAKNPRLQCAGLNRHEAEEEEASREKTSDPLGPEFCVGHREVHDEA